MTKVSRLTNRPLKVGTILTLQEPDQTITCNFETAVCIRQGKDLAGCPGSLVLAETLCK